MRLLTNFNRFRRTNSGFALISTLSIVVLLALIAVGLLSLSSMSLRQGANAESNEEAKKNAKLGLFLAINDLQRATGPDLRASATGDLLLDPQDDSFNNRKNWVGVWRTDDYNQTTPADKTFERWLVSNNTNGLIDEDDLTTYALNSSVVIYEEGDTANNNEPNDVVVDKVSLTDSTGNNTGSYAFWVTDEGVKASLDWNEGYHDNDAASKVIARLSSSPGIDHGMFLTDKNPFSAAPSYPLLASNGNFLDKTDKLSGLADTFLANGSDENPATWVKEHTHELTTSSYGVLANMKLGGLKRDLSLAFEMDGLADYGTDELGDPINIGRPSLFDSQVGEFVGGTDRLAAPEANAANNNISERYVYRNENDDGAWFSGGIDDISHDQFQAVSRGTNWWNLRDFSQLYKKMSLNGDNYSLGARAMYPNRTQNTYKTIGNNDKPYDLTVMTGLNMNYEPARSQYADRGLSSGYKGYVPYPSRGNYAPALIGNSCFISVKSHDGNLALALDPVFQLWNPYNVEIRVNKYALVSQDAYPGLVSLKVEKNGVEKRYGTAMIGQLINQQESFVTGRDSHKVTFIIDDLVLQPGEVILLSAKNEVVIDNASKKVNMELEKGVQMSNNSGIIITSLPEIDPDTGLFTMVNVPLASNDVVHYAYHNSLNFDNGSFYIDDNDTPDDEDDDIVIPNKIGAARMRVGAYLPRDGITASNLSNGNNYGDVLQYKQANTFATQSIITEGYEIQKTNNKNEGNVTYFGGIAASSINDVKKTFGAVSRLNRAALDNRSSVQSSNDIGEFESYTQLNPIDIITTANMWRESEINKMFTMVCKEGGYNAIRDALGLDYPFDPSGGSGSVENGYYGNSYVSAFDGSTHFQQKTIPPRQMYSLLELRGASTAVHSHEPFSPLGDSFANPFIDPSGIYDTYEYHVADSKYASIADHSWLFNDAMFDRYFFSGIAPLFSISNSGYSLDAGASITDTLTKFYSNDPSLANANNVLVPYVPSDLSVAQIINELDDTTNGTGYSKMAAYCLIKGLFNVNSTSVRAWASLLRANTDIDVNYDDSSNSDENEGTPFPAGVSSIEGSTGTQDGWVGLSRLSEDEIWNDQNTPNDTSDDTGLAVEIVNQVRLRGPFMSLADFINRTPAEENSTDTDEEKVKYVLGALQAAVEVAGIYDDFHDDLDTEETNYRHVYFNYNEDRRTATGIAGDITQSKLLLPIAPKLNARSDTFKIRSYGESANGSKAYCEAVLQRLPEYFDNSDSPWVEPMTNPIPLTTLVANSSMEPINQQLGRKFKIVSFKWIDAP